MSRCTKIELNLLNIMFVMIDDGFHEYFPQQNYDGWLLWPYK